MRAIVQRVSHASVRVDGTTVGDIGRGICVFVGVGPGDTELTARHLAERIATLRIHPDDQGRMNRNLEQSGGDVLVVSQFTLFADTTHGHRPSFIGAGPPDMAEKLCEAFVVALRKRGILVATGRFAAHMDVELINDGPVTLVVSSEDPAWITDAG